MEQLLIFIIKDNFFNKKNEWSINFHFILIGLQVS